MNNSNICFLNTVRKAILEIYKQKAERECYFLVRPLIEETWLDNIYTAPISLYMFSPCISIEQN